MKAKLLSRLVLVVGAGVVGCSSSDDGKSPTGTGSGGAAAGGSSAGGSSAGGSSAGGSSAGGSAAGGSMMAGGMGGGAGMTGAAGGGFVDTMCTMTSSSCACGAGTYCSSCLTPNGGEPCCVPCGAVPGRPLVVDGLALVARPERRAGWS